MPILNKRLIWKQPSHKNLFSIRKSKISDFESISHHMQYNQYA